jgi:hypothetical protein
MTYTKNHVIATRYGLGRPGIENRREARFSAPFQTVPGAHTANYTIHVVWCGLNHPPTYSVEVKERVELYL